MLEAKVNLRQAIKEKKPNEEVKTLFIKYYEAFNKMKNPNKKDIEDMGKLYSIYLDYVGGGK